jgi:diguanylate cyclase (GGDEF)-like protein
MVVAAQVLQRREHPFSHRWQLSDWLALTSLQIALVLAAAIPLLLIAPQLSQQRGDSLTYAVWGSALLIGGIAALLRGRRAEQRMKLRWHLLALALCGGAVGYLIASANNFAAVMHVLDPLMIASGSAGAAALLLSITVSFTGAPKGIILLDLLQTALFVTLSYIVNAGSNPWTRDVQGHVLISLSLNFVLFLTAAVSPFSATTREERSFFRMIAVYLGAGWIARFVSSQVGYLWMHSTGNLYDLPSIGICVALALYLIEDLWRTAGSRTADCEIPQRRLFLRNLMPSLLAFGSLVSALYVFLHAWLPGFVAVLTALVLYLARTMLLQTHMSHEAVALRHRNEQLEQMSQRDALTGAGNRRSLAACYKRCTEASNAGQQPIALLLVDLDFFKQANDRLGHLHGDRILIAVTTILHAVSSTVAGSHVARFGGDEFALLLPQLEVPQAAELAEAVRAGVADLIFDAGDRPISVSIGGSVTDGTHPLNEVIRRADVALYRAKLAGRNRAEFHLEDVSLIQTATELALVPAAL